MSEILPSLAYQLGIGGIGGLIVGYTIKKLSKLIVILIGLFLIILLYMGTSGILNINYEKFGEALTSLFSFVGQVAPWLIGLISLLPFLGSFIVGFALGFKFG